MENVNGIERMRKEATEVRKMVEARNEDQVASILDALRMALDEVVTNGYWIQKAVDDASRGNFNSLGSLQGNATQFDIAIAKCSVLLSLLPEDIRKRLEAAARA